MARVAHADDLPLPLRVPALLVEAALERVGMAHRAKHLPSQLSGGQQQRVAVARAVAGEPLILLADEPTGNLDPDLSLDIMNLFREINARGTTVVVATHDRELIRRVGRRTLTLHDSGAYARFSPYGVTKLAAGRWSMLAWNVPSALHVAHVVVDELKQVLGSLGLKQGRTAEDCKQMIFFVSLEPIFCYN